MVGIVTVGALGSTSASDATPAFGAGPAVFALFGMGVLAFVLLRAAPAGAYPRPDGIRVRNVFRTETIAWDRIEGFSLRLGKPWWAKYAVFFGHVDLTDGTSVLVSGIQANYGTAKASRLIEELNSLLAQRRGGPRRTSEAPRSA